jgi:hypothetical protein
MGLFHLLRVLLYEAQVGAGVVDDGAQELLIGALLAMKRPVVFLALSRAVLFALAAPAFVGRRATADAAQVKVSKLGHDWVKLTRKKCL